MLDLVNTVDGDRDRIGPDVLTSYADAVHWAGRASLADAALQEQLSRLAAEDPLAASKALARLIEGREALYEIFLAEADVRLPAAKAVDAIRSLTKEAVSYRTLVAEDGHFAWKWEKDGLDGILHRAGFAAAELLTRATERRRIRQCGGRKCGWLFLDSSRPGRRRWCSEEGCGTGERVRRFRSKSG